MCTTLAFYNFSYIDYKHTADETGNFFLFLWSTIRIQFNTIVIIIIINKLSAEYLDSFFFSFIAHHYYCLANDPMVAAIDDDDDDGHSFWIYAFDLFITIRFDVFFCCDRVLTKMIIFYNLVCLLFFFPIDHITVLIQFFFLFCFYHPRIRMDTMLLLLLL